MMCSLNNEGRSVVGGFVQHAPPSRCETPPCVEYVCVCVFLFSFFSLSWFCRLLGFSAPSFRARPVAEMDPARAEMG